MSEPQVATNDIGHKGQHAQQAAPFAAHTNRSAGPSFLGHGALAARAPEVASGASGSAGAASSRGPFAPAVNGLLRNCFGHMVDDVSVTRGEGAKNRGIAADAHTIGKRISLGDKIKEDPTDLHSMEVIAHEVSHALAGGGAGHHILNKPGDAGEAAAYDAGRGFKDFIASGGQGPAPQLKPAAGGQAVIHRWESGEHVRAVDNAVNVLDEEKKAGRTDGVPVSDSVREQLTTKIHLQNGMDLTPGQITALMGDFYGRFKDNGDLDVAASFDQLNRADKKEMTKLIGALDKEVNEHKTNNNIELNQITADRSKKKNDDGKIDLTYLELAKKNNSHFSADNMTETNNNMGCYAAFHEMALREAQKGDAKSIMRARAMEACGMHYLTDRHSSGHNIEKNGVMDASGYERDGNTANAYVKTIHDDLNKNGITVENNDKTAKDKEWRAYGDDHWDDVDNKENRFRTAKSVVTSYNELDAVINKTKTVEDIKKDGFGAKDMVPKFSKQRQEGAEQTARNLNPAEAWWKGLVRGGAPDVAEYGWNWTKDKIGNGVDWVTEKAGAGWDWTKKTATSGFNWATDKIHNGVDWAKEKASDGIDWAKEKASDGVDWAKKTGQAGLDWTKKTASDGADWTKDKIHNGLDWTKKTGQAGWDWTKKTASDGVDWAKEKASDGVDWTKDKIHNGVDWTKKKASDAWDGTKNLTNQAVDGAKDLGNSAVKKTGEAWDGAKHLASSGLNWLKKW